MIVLKDGKEVKGATIIFNHFGNPSAVFIEGVRYNAKAFTFEEAKPKKKTKTTKSKVTKKKK